MALNQNHIFEDIDEIKCSIVEKNCTKQRCDFLKALLEHNNYKVVIKNTTNAANESITETIAETYTIGVTDVTFNYIKAIFNRELKAQNGNTVTPDYWKQINAESDDKKWYWK
ncbi:MAG: hypothetical protein HUU47_09700 [Bacteroidetes bacterium]|nr:hypothetical protein [Bacteroidota bacterium]